MDSLSCVEINPSAPAVGSVIWLHGLGADGNDFVPIVPEFRLPVDLPIRFVFPHAPLRSVTLNNGYVMRAWFDIRALDKNITQGVDQKGILESVKSIEQLIEKEIQRGIPSEKIILSGFSQGSVIALITGLCYPKKLGGILALSGFLPGTEQLIAATSEANRSIPIFLAHGIEDTVIPHALGQVTYSFLKKHNYPVSWHSYRMAHSVCPDEIHDIARWLTKEISNTATVKV